MIYIMTPMYSDFIQQCQKLKIHPKSPEVVFVDSWDKFCGRKINEDDKIIEGDKFYLFELAHQEKILQEIFIRSRM